MCNRESKVCFMKVAVVFLSLSFVTQVIGLLIPDWLHVEIDGKNFSGADYTGSDRANHNNEYEHYNTGRNYDRIDEDMHPDFNDTWLNETGEIETDTHANRSFAVWYIMTCVNGVCQMELYPELINGTYSIQNYFEPGYNFSWVDARVPLARQREFQVELTISLVLTLISTILVSKLIQDTAGRITEKCHLRRHCISIAIIWLSGTLVGIPTREYLYANNKVHTFASQQAASGMGFSPVTVYSPFGLIFSGFSNILSAIAFLFIFLTLSIRKKQNTVHRTETSTLNQLELVGSQRGQMAPLAPPPSFSANECATEITPVRNVFLDNYPSYRNSLHANTQTDDTGFIDEQPPPSYEETMRLYNYTDSSNVCYKEGTKHY